LNFEKPYIVCMSKKYGEKILLFFEVQSYSKFGHEMFGPFRSSVVRSSVGESFTLCPMLPTSISKG
jgi:hypothetical protein